MKMQWRGKKKEIFQPVSDWVALRAEEVLLLLNVDIAKQRVVGIPEANFGQRLKKASFTSR